MLFFLVCRGSSQPRNVNVVTVYDIQNKFIGKGWWMPRRMEPSDILSNSWNIVCDLSHLL